MCTYVAPEVSVLGSGFPELSDWGAPELVGPLGSTDADGMACCAECACFPSKIVAVRSLKSRLEPKNMIHNMNLLLSTVASVHGQDMDT